MSPARTLGVVNPATGQVFTEVPVTTAAELDAAFAAAAAAQPAWAADEEARRQALRELAVAIPAAAEELTDLLVSETGKPYQTAVIEFTAAKLWFDWLAEADLPVEVIADDAAARIELRRRPLGVIAGITPWNFPVSMICVKAGPALRAGNAFVMKPSPFTPLTAIRVGEIIKEIVPPGIYETVVGDDDLGEAMARHPLPRKISFTGSIEAGKSVAATAGADLKRTTMELGGNDAAILLDDIDIAEIVPAVLARAYFNTGQTCAIPKRIYVPSALFGEVTDAFVAAAEAQVIGTGPEATFGSLSTKPQYERVRELVADALAGGATAVTGGAAIDGDGYFFEPTVITDVDEGVRIVAEEQFGPAIPLLPYDTVDEAVRRANDTMYGLTGSVWGTDLDRAEEVTARLECGVSYVNSHGVHRPELPIFGVKWSGVGAEHGMEGLLEHTDRHVIFRPSAPIDTALES